MALKRLQYGPSTQKWKKRSLLARKLQNPPLVKPSKGVDGEDDGGGNQLGEGLIGYLGIFLVLVVNCDLDSEDLEGYHTLYTVFFNFAQR